MKYFYSLFLNIAALLMLAPLGVSAQIPDGEWKVLGKGVYYDDIFTMTHFVKGLNWEVTIEESLEVPGWYRFIPYGDGCAKEIIAILGTTDNETYMYVNATNPQKVWIPKSTYASCYNIQSSVPENGYYYDYYLKLEKGIISGKDGCMMYQHVSNGNQWSLTNFFNGFRIVLPEGDYKDYTLKVRIENSCEEHNEIPYTIEAGKDIKSFKSYVIKGYQDLNGTESENLALAMDNGSIIPDKGNVCKGDSRGRYTLIVAGLNEQGEGVSAAATYFYHTDDETEQWQSIGTGEFTEDIIASLYPDVNTQKVNVNIEEHKTRKGYFRLVNPIENLSYFEVHPNMYRPHTSHNHYLYVNAEDPEAVYIEDSPIGANLYLGDISILSQAWLYIQEGLSKEYIKTLGYFGTREGREITFPEYTLLLHERFGYAKKPEEAQATLFRITLPKGYTGIENIIDDSNAPCEYYNIHGIKLVEKPTSTGIYIRRQGSQTEKIIIK